MVLLINRRRPLSPWLVLGLLPMAISGYWVLGLTGWLTRTALNR